MKPDLTNLPPKYLRSIGHQHARMTLLLIVIACIMAGIAWLGSTHLDFCRLVCIAFTFINGFYAGRHLRQACGFYMAADDEEDRLEELKNPPRREIRLPLP